MPNPHAKFLALKNSQAGPLLGEAIARVSSAVSKPNPAQADLNELQNFISDPAGWLDNYAKIDDGTPAGKKIKGNLTIMPVFDTNDVMFVKVPVVGDLGNLSGPAPGDSYINYKDFLAGYFIKKCR